MSHQSFAGFYPLPRYLCVSVQVAVFNESFKRCLALSASVSCSGLGAEVPSVQSCASRSQEQELKVRFVAHLTHKIF